MPWIPNPPLAFAGVCNLLTVGLEASILTSYSWLQEFKLKRHKNDRLQGTLDLLVLKALASLGPLNGYTLTLRIEQVSENVLHLEEGSLYPALHRMTQMGWLKAEWGASENNRRARFYTITARGTRQLAEEEANWAKLTEAVGKVLQLA